MNEGIQFDTQIYIVSGKCNILVHRIIDIIKITINDTKITSETANCYR